MIGNDVVDLGDDEAREGAQHPRFDARVFTAGELSGRMHFLKLEVPVEP